MLRSQRARLPALTPGRALLHNNWIVPYCGDIATQRLSIDSLHILHGTGSGATLWPEKQLLTEAKIPSDADLQG